MAGGEGDAVSALAEDEGRHARVNGVQEHSIFLVDVVESLLQLVVVELSRGPA